MTKGEDNEFMLDYDSALRIVCQICVGMVNYLIRLIFEEAHGTRCSIQLGEENIMT